MKVFSSIAVQPAVESLLPRFVAESGIRPDFAWNTAPALGQAPAGRRDGRPADPQPRRHGHHASRRPHSGRLGDDACQLARRDRGQGRRAAARHRHSRGAEAHAARGARDLLLRSRRRRRERHPFCQGDRADGHRRREINAKNRFPPPGGLCARFLPTGEVELAIQQVPELKQVAGIEIVGPLPEPFQLVTVFVAGIEKASAKAAEARALLDFLRSPPAVDGVPREWSRSGLGSKLNQSIEFVCRQ